MCNCYRITPKKGADKGVRAKVSAAAGKLASSLVRPSDPGIVVPGFLAGGGRWDFQPFGGLLAVAPCDSPLKRKSPPQDDPQGGLWDWEA